MSFYQGRPSLLCQFRLVLSSFLHKDGLPFSEALGEEEIRKAFDEEGASFASDEGSIYTPAVTLWAFLSQVLHKEEQRSCLAAVARVAVLLVALGRRPCSGNTGAYCRARAKLSQSVIERLTRQMAAGCEDQLAAAWLWHGRHVKLADGTTVSMPDTAENQAEYPQQGGQQKGLGFPIVRMVVLLSLATGMLTDMAMGAYAGKQTSEMALMRALLDSLQSGDVFLADRYYCSYFMVAMLQQRGIDFVVRLHQARPVDFRRGRRLGQGDRLITWQRPRRPSWMDQAVYDRMPESIEVRQLQLRVDQPGFRTESLVVVTSLGEAREYSPEEVAQLYRRRWLAELDLRTIKITLGMDVLRCRTPEMARRELWVHLLAYNLIRRSILQSAQESGRSPRELSFTAAMQAVAASWMVAACADDLTFSQFVAAHLANLSAHRIGHRPDRIEPRAIKRRPKPHRLLTQPRAEARAALLANPSP